MRRFWLEPTSIHGNSIQITGDRFKHICGVCRMEVGAKFEILIGDGKAYFVQLAEVNKKDAFADILEIREIEGIQKPYIHLYLSIPKIPKMEWIFEKSVELGVQQITPFVSDYSFIRKLGGPLQEKKKRWEKIVESACQQSARAEKMQINDAMHIDKLLENFNQNDKKVGLFAYEGEGQISLKEALKADSFQNAEEIAVFVGSEGGFSDQEVDKFKAIGLDPVSLGKQVLRVETACLALVSVIKYEMNLFDWT